MSMDLPGELEVGSVNYTPPEVQLKLYQFVKELDDQYDFEHGMLIYHHLLSALNQYFTKLEND